MQGQHNSNEIPGNIAADATRGAISGNLFEVPDTAPAERTPLDVAVDPEKTQVVKVQQGLGNMASREIVTPPNGVFVYDNPAERTQVLTAQPKPFIAPPSAFGVGSTPQTAEEFVARAIQQSRYDPGAAGHVRSAYGQQPQSPSRPVRPPRPQPPAEQVAADDQFFDRRNGW